jgi:hypothetical protein
MAKPKFNPEGILKTFWLLVLKDIYLTRIRPFRQQMGTKFKEETIKCYILTRNLCGAENWTLRKLG